MICPICDKGKFFRVVKNFEENKEYFECCTCNTISSINGLKYGINEGKEIETVDPTPDDIEDLFDTQWK